MNTETFEFSVNIPSVDEFALAYPHYGPFALGDYRFLFERLMTPECYIRARVTILDLDLPAVAGVAKLCYQVVEDRHSIKWSNHLKQFIGAVICCLMEANEFQKTGKKKTIPHHAFTKGEVYRLADTGSVDGS